jgi:hypothetical protein
MPRIARVVAGGERFQAEQYANNRQDVSFSGDYRMSAIAMALPAKDSSPTLAE